MQSLVGVLDDVLAELLEVDLVVAVEVALLEQFLDEVLVLGVLLLVGPEDNGELLLADLAVVVEVEVVEGEPEVLPAVGGRLGEAGGDELVVGELSVVVDVHVLDDLLDVLEVGVVVVLLEVLRQLLHRKVPVLVLVDLQEHLPQQAYLLLRELGRYVVQHQHLELRCPIPTLENFE